MIGSTYSEPTVEYQGSSEEMNIHVPTHFRFLLANVS